MGLGAYSLRLRALSSGVRGQGLELEFRIWC
jgi:hypothetical protein